MSLTKEQFLDKFKNQKTFVLLKPDAVQRGLVGEVISHFEKKVLKITAIKMIQATEEQVRAHYPMKDNVWLTRLGEKSLSSFEGLGLEPKEILGTDDKLTIGKKVAESLVDYFLSGPSILMVIEGLQAVESVRKIIGHTLPHKADAGTIRADYSIDTPLIANVEARAIHNLIHASETLEEAEHEINLRFGDVKLLKYKRTDEKVAYSADDRL